MSESVDKLMKMKTKVESSEREYLQLEGQLKGEKESIYRDFECVSVEEAESKLSEMDSKISAMEIEFESKVSELSSKYAW